MGASSGDGLCRQRRCEAPEGQQARPAALAAADTLAVQLKIPGGLVSLRTVSDVGFRKDELVLPASHSSETLAPRHDRWPPLSANAAA